MTIRQAFWGILSLNGLAIIIALAIGIHTGNPGSQFGETKFITKFSALQLLAIGWLAFSIFKVRRPPRGESVWRSPALLWLLMACGFCFLALDELLKIHERMDTLIHFVFQMKETALSDRIDDLIVGLYGLLGLGVLWYFRAELRLFRPALPYFIGGFIFLFAMVAVDLLGNAKDVLPALVNPEQVQPLLHWLSALEESLKIIGEAIFILAFYCIFRQIEHLKNQPV